MTAGTRSGAVGIWNSNRTTPRIRQAPSSNLAQSRQDLRCASTCGDTDAAPSMAAERLLWATSHLTGHLLFLERLHQRGPGSMHAALDRSDPGLEDRRGLLVREPQDRSEEHT